MGWIANQISNIASWVGSGVASLIEWLLGGLDTLLSKVIDAANGLWDVFDSLFNFAVGFKDSLIRLVAMAFPFFPEPVSMVIGLGLFAVIIAGIVRVVRK